MQEVESLARPLPYRPRHALSQVTAQEVEALLSPAQLDSPGFLRVQLESETSEGRTDPLFRLGAGFRRVAHHDEVVGVAHQCAEMRALACPHRIEDVEVDVRQERRDNSSLRGARDHLRLDAILHHAHLEPLPKQLEYPSIRDSARDEHHQLVVFDAPKVVANVRIEHVVASATAYLAAGLQRLRRATARPEGARALEEIRLEEPLGHQLPRHVAYPGPDPGVSQRA